MITNYIGFKKKPDSTLFKYRVDFRSKESEELETWIKKTLFALYVINRLVINARGLVRTDAMSALKKIG